MTSSSSAGYNTKSSRFSTLKVFKSFSHKEKGEVKPPPPPPKDPYYVRNRSLASLSPDSISLPNTPSSPPYQYPQRPLPFAHPSSSSMSLVSSISPADSVSQVGSNMKKDKLSGLLKPFKRGSSKSPSIKSPPMGEVLSPEQSEPDDSISMPWNFQHHIHVDEGYAGLPPSWTASLANLGYREEEIAAIQEARRAQTRSPASMFSCERPGSPAFSVRTTTSSNAPLATGPIVARPTPRTTSLPRQYSSTSLSQSDTPSTSSSASTPPTSYTMPMPSRKPNAGSLSSLSISVDADDIEDANITITDQTPADIPPVATSVATPPNRRLVLVNASPSLSPPPSYASSVISHSSYHPSDNKDSTLFDSTPGTSSPPTTLKHKSSTDTIASGSSGHSRSSITSYNSARRRSKRSTVRPPRLSLHNDNDLSLWSETLLSSIPSELSGSSKDVTPNSFISGPLFSSLSPISTSPSNNSHITRPSDRSISHSKSLRSPPPSRPIPPVIVQPGEEEDDQQDDGLVSSRAVPSSSARSTPASWGSQEPLSPIWDTVEDVLDRPDMNSQEVSHCLSPAISDSHSPILPLTPHTNGQRPSSEIGVRTAADQIPTSEWLEEEPEDEDDRLLTADGTNGSNRHSSRSSTSTVSTVTITHVTATKVLQNSSAAAKVMTISPSMREESPSAQSYVSAPLMQPRTYSPAVESLKLPASPMSSTFSSEEGSGSGSSISHDQQTPTEATSPPLYYMESEQDQFSPDARMLVSTTDTFGGVHKAEAADEESDLEDYEDYEDVDVGQVGNVTSRTNIATQLPRPTIVINGAHVKPGPFTAMTPGTPSPRYQGWLSGLVKPLEEYIDEPIDPRQFYLDLQEIAEGESGSVFVAKLIPTNHHKLKLSPIIRAQDVQEFGKHQDKLVAIKIIAINPSGSSKLEDLRREFELLKGLTHPNILTLDAMYVDLVEDSLWVRMELMERSLADVIELVAEGLIIQDRTIARFARDILEGLVYLQAQRIAHRDIRSDNILLNSAGELKLTDFSNAVLVGDLPMCSDRAGIAYWQAPEIREGPYNALKVDVWSLGATVWELAQAEPPFQRTGELGNQWPPLRKPEIFPPAFHEFLRLCSEPAQKRPYPKELLRNAFVINACGRPVIQLLLQQCTTIEKALQDDL